VPVSWDLIAAVVGGLLLVYIALLVLLVVYARRHPETIGLKDALRLLPDLLRLLRRLLSDRTLTVGLRIRLGLLLAYLLSPIDLVPDFVPLIGYADDVIIVALVLRSVIARAGACALERHWPGTPEGLLLVLSLAGLAGTPGKGTSAPPQQPQAGSGPRTREHHHEERRPEAQRNTGRGESP
jgi:uncharacterized membrane protein YkvA (DUF1232 family)